MAKTEIEEFVIKMGLDPNGIDKKMNNLVSNIARNLKSSLTSLASSVIAPAFAGLVAGDFVQSVTEEIAEVDRLSKSMNMNIEDASAWTAAMGRMGIEAGDVRDMFRDFADWMVDFDANDSGPLKDGIEQGIIPAVRDMNGEMKSAQDYVLEFADALNRLDPQTAAGLANQIGLSDRDIASFVEQGGKAIREQLQQQKDLGTYTENDAKITKEFQAAISDLTRAFKMMFIPVIRAVLPVLTKLSQGMIQVRKHIVALLPFLSGIGIFAMIKGVSSMTAQWGSLTKAILTASKAAKAFIFSPWGAVLMVLAAIGLIIEDFITWINGNDKNAFGRFYEKIFGSPEHAKELISKIIDTITNEIEFLSIFIDEHWDFIKLAAGWIFFGSSAMQALRLIFTGMSKIAGLKVWSIMAKGIKGLLPLLARVPFAIKAISVAMRVMSASSGIFGLAFAILLPIVLENIDTIKELFSGLGDTVATVCEYISDVFASIGDAFSQLVNMISQLIDFWIGIFTNAGEIISQVCAIIIGIFNAIGDAFNAVVSAVVSGAQSIIQWITAILSKCAELASNSIFGKIAGAIGGGIDFLFSGGGGGGSNDYSTHYTNNTYNIDRTVDLGNSGRFSANQVAWSQ